MLRSILTVLPLLTLCLAGDSFPAKLNPLGKSPVPHGLGALGARDCPGGPTNSFCCGAINYCFTGEVCCADGGCCPEGTTCLGGFKCSPGGVFTATGTFTETPASITPPPTVTSTFIEYTTYYYTITWYYFSYFYTYDVTEQTSVIASAEETTYSYFTITATDSAAAAAEFTSISASVTFSTPYSATALATATAAIPSASSSSVVSAYPIPSTTGGNYTSPTTSSAPQFTGAAAPRAGGVWGVVAAMGAVGAGVGMVVL